MATVYDVPADALINRAAAQLQKRSEVTQPDWAAFAKTGVHTEKPPEQDNWWHIRAAAVLRKLYTKGPIGVERLRAEFGGARDRGSKPNKARRGSGSITRHVLQQLEEAGLASKAPGGAGRIVSDEGRKFLDGVAHEVKKDLEADIPELAKY